MQLDFSFPLLESHREKLLNHYRNQAVKMKDNADSTVVFDKKPEISAEKLGDVLKDVRDAFRKGMSPSHNGAYIDILQELGGGLKALDIRDPLLNLFDYGHNLFAFERKSAPENWKDWKPVAAKDYYIRIMYSRMLQWAKFASPLIRHHQLSSLTCQFKSPVPITATTSPQHSDYTSKLDFPSTQILFKILRESVLKTGPGSSVSLYHLFRYQSDCKPPAQKIVFSCIDEINGFFLSFTNHYCACISGSSSVPLKNTYKWYSKPIDQLLPECFHNFLSEFSSHASLVDISGLKLIIGFYQAAVAADIRVARSVSPYCVAQILTVVINRVVVLTTETYPNADNPNATNNLRQNEWMTCVILTWIVSIIKVLLNDKPRSKTSDDLVLLYDIYDDSEDMMAVSALLTAIRPLFVRVLTSKMNPAMYFIMLSIIEDVISMRKLSEKVLLLFLTKKFWAALTTAFTDPFLDSDPVRLFYGSTTLFRLADGTMPEAPPSAEDFNFLFRSKCCDILIFLGSRALTRSSPSEDSLKLGIVGITLLKRGVVPFLLEQDAFYPDDTNICSTLAIVLNRLSRSRDGRVLMLRSSEMGSRFAGIDLLRHFLLHSSIGVVHEALLICNFLAMVV